MCVARLFATLLLLSCAASGLCSLFAVKGYIASSAPVRSLLMKTGISNLVKRKSEKLYKVSNFQSVYDQGTGIRISHMNDHDIVEISDLPENYEKFVDVKTSRSGYMAGINSSPAKDDDGRYSERLFSLLTQMDKKSCVYRLMCEIGSDPKSFGDMGSSLNEYFRSGPLASWSSLAHEYQEAFDEGSQNGKESCIQEYGSCPYTMNQFSSFLGIMLNPM